MNLKDVYVWFGLAVGALGLIVAFLYFQKNIRPKNPNYKPGDGPKPDKNPNSPLDAQVVIDPDSPLPPDRR